MKDSPGEIRALGVALCLAFTILIVSCPSTSAASERLSANSELAGRTIKDSEIRTKYGVIVVYIKKASGEVIFNPDASVVLEEGDTFVAIGEKSNLNRLLVDGQTG